MLAKKNTATNAIAQMGIAIPNRGRTIKTIAKIIASSIKDNKIVIMILRLTFFRTKASNTLLRVFLLVLVFGHLYIGNLGFHFKCTSSPLSLVDALPITGAP
jgi:hypothetical protein